MTYSFTRTAVVLLAQAVLVCSCSTTEARNNVPVDARAPEEVSMLVQYLEIVTPDVDATCDALAKLHGVTFGKPDAGLGNARTAALKSGGRIGVRAPMGEHEQPVVRPYVLVKDIEAAVAAAKAAGGEIALGATEIPGHGKFAIYFLGGIQHGLWQL